MKFPSETGASADAGPAGSGIFFCPQDMQGTGAGGSGIRKTDIFIYKTCTKGRRERRDIWRRDEHAVKERQRLLEKRQKKERKKKWTTGKQS